MDELLPPPGPASIILKTTPTGKKITGKEYEVNKEYEVTGNEIDIFSTLCDALHDNQELFDIVKKAIYYLENHDPATCPFCNEQ